MLELKQLEEDISQLEQTLSFKQKVNHEELNNVKVYTEKFTSGSRSSSSVDFEQNHTHFKNFKEFGIFI